MALANSITSTGAPDEFFDGVLLNDFTAQWSPSSYRYSQSENRPSWKLFSSIINMWLDAREADVRLANLEPNPYSVVQLARQKLQSVSNKMTAQQAEKLLDGLENALMRRDDSNYPAIELFEQGDGSLHFEWVLDDSRVGFNIELDPSESGWYVVKKSKESSIQEWGFLNDLDLQHIINQID